MATRISQAVKARKVAREAARKAYVNGAEPSQAALIGRRVAARMARSNYYTPLFFKSQEVPVGTVAEDPTVMYHPLARQALNQRDPTMVAVDEVEVQVKDTGTAGFFDTLPSWVVPVAIGVVAVLAILMISRISANPKPVSQD